MIKRLTKKFEFVHWFLLFVLGAVLLCQVAVRLPFGGETEHTKAPASRPCTEYDGEYDIVFIEGSADVYGGVDSPSSNVKGTVTGGAGGIEASCSRDGKFYYRLQGANWWGWVLASDTTR